MLMLSLLLLIIYIDSSSESCSRDYKKGMVNTEHNTEIMTGYKIAGRDGVSLLECSMLCQREPNCKIADWKGTICKLYKSVTSKRKSSVSGSDSVVLSLVEVSSNVLPITGLIHSHNILFHFSFVSDHSQRSCSHNIHFPHKNMIEKTHVL